MYRPISDNLLNVIRLESNILCKMGERVDKVIVTSGGRSLGKKGDLFLDISTKLNERLHCTSRKNE